MMDVWTLVTIGVLSTFFGGLALGVFNTSVKLFYKKAWTRIAKRPLIKPKLMAEMRMLEQEVKPRLLKINAIPSYPDFLKPMEIREILEDLEGLAHKLEHKDFAEIRSRLLALAAHTGEINVNTNPLAFLKSIGRETAITLKDDIELTIAETKKVKKERRTCLKPTT